MRANPRLWRRFCSVVHDVHELAFEDVLHQLRQARVVLAVESRRRAVEVVAGGDGWWEIVRGRSDEFDPSSVMAFAARRGEPAFTWLQMALAQVEVKPRRSP